MTTNDVFAYLKNKIKAISKVVKNKAILQKFIHRIKGLLDERSGECIKA
jgi:hypothetical protein